MDISIPLEIHGVPDAETAAAICDTIQKTLLENYHTDMWVTFEEIDG